jgi:hypothetical protein
LSSTAFVEIEHHHFLTSNSHLPNMFNNKEVVGEQPMKREVLV